MSGRLQSGRIYSLGVQIMRILNYLAYGFKTFLQARLAT